MKPILWLLLAELCFFFVALINIIHGIFYLLDPTYLSYVILFCMFVTWSLNKYITYLFIQNNVTVDDLLGNPK